MTGFAQRSSQERLWIIGGALAALVIVLIGWVLLIAPQRSETDTVNADAGSVRSSNTQQQSRILSLQAQSKNMGSVRAALAAAQRALPNTSGVPDFLRSLQSLGSSTGTDVVSLTVGQPTDVTSVASGSTAGPTAAPTTAAPSAGAAPSANSVYALTISAQVNGSTDRLNTFLDRLQNVQPRAVLVTHITEGTTDGTSGSALQLTMQAFVAPGSAAELTQLSRAAGK